MRVARRIVLNCFPAIPLHAARTTDVVIDASGAPVAGAVVTAGGAPATTGEAGSFVLLDGPDGRAQVRATAPGFAPAPRTGQDGRAGLHAVRRT
ncbi:MAG: carboxypeptidase regulatory-like domain-containing protein [Acidobacteria bacterium]|nr:carboxypeptidase regulatory-like domain-containing protein [Acidobacteriota bacterium]